MTQRGRILRLSRRRTLAEITDPIRIREQLFEVDGDIDTEMSVYKIEGIHQFLTRIKAEHNADSNLDPQARVAADITDLISVACVPDPESGYFSFRNSAHELVFFGQNPDDASKVAQIISEDPSKFLYPTDKVSVDEYGRRCYKNGDAEWVGCASDPEYTNVKKWVTKEPRK